MPALTFYRGNGACSFGLHVLLRELNIPFDTVLMKYDPVTSWSSVDDSLTNEAYRKIHPAGYVPCLVADSQPITENPAIFTYVALLAPPERSDSLLGASSPLNRARVVEWMTWLSGSLHGYGYGMFFKPVRFSDDASQHEIIRERGAGLIRAAYDRIEGRLEGRDFFVGDAETIVDYYATIFWYWGRKYGFEVKEKYPNYTRLVARMEQKASLRAAAEEESVPLSTA